MWHSQYLLALFVYFKILLQFCMWRLYFICLQKIWNSTWYVFCIKILEHKNSLFFSNVRKCEELLLLCVFVCSINMLCLCVCACACVLACVCACACTCVCHVSSACVHIGVHLILCGLWLFFFSPSLISTLLASSSNFHHYAASFGKMRMVNILMDIVKVKPCEIWGSLSHSNVSKSLLICYTRSDGK